MNIVIDHKGIKKEVNVNFTKVMKDFLEVESAKQRPKYVARTLELFGFGEFSAAWDRMYATLMKKDDKGYPLESEYDFAQRYKE